MKKIAFFLILLLLLVGCSERELVFDRKYPNTSKIDSIRAQNTSNQALNDSEFSKLINSRKLPEQIDIGVESVDEGYGAWPLDYCWGATYEECAHIKPRDIFNTEQLGIQLPYVTFKANSKVTLTYFNLATYNKELPIPDDIEVYIFNKDLTLTPYPYRKENDYTYEFQTPSETIGSNMFMFKAIYKTNIGGVTYYPIHITNK